MQPTSQLWKDEHKKILVGESFVELFYGQFDPDSVLDATASDNGTVYFANTSQIAQEVEKNIVRYATLEQNLCLLNGSLHEIPLSNFGDTGYISQSLSNASGVFDVVPIIELTFSRVHQPVIPGITITWADTYDEYAESFKVTAYNNAAVVAEKVVNDNTSVTSEVHVDIQGYNRIRIEVLKWCLPLRRARISHVFVGIYWTYSKGDLVSFEHIQEVDPLSTTLPKVAIKFEIDNSDDVYNPFNPNSQSRYIMQRQEIRARYGYRLGGTIEWIKGGVFYMDEWDAPQNGITASFEARDLLEFMRGQYMKGRYVETGVSLYDLAVGVLQEATLPLNLDGSVKWQIHDSLRNVFTVAPLPLLSMSDCLMRIANAARCVLFTDRAGILRIEPAPTAFIVDDTRAVPLGWVAPNQHQGDLELIGYTINDLNSFRRSDITLTPPCRQVDVDTYSYVVHGTSSELFYDTLAVSGTQTVWIKYRAPAVDVHATVTGGTLVSAEYYAYACKLTITAAGAPRIRVMGKALNIAKALTAVTTGVAEGEVVEIDNPLIADKVTALAVGEWAKNYLTNRKVLSSEWRADPAVDALDIVAVANNYGTSKVRLTSVKFAYKGAFRGESEGRVLDAMA